MMIQTLAQMRMNTIFHHVSSPHDCYANTVSICVFESAACSHLLSFAFQHTVIFISTLKLEIPAALNKYAECTLRVTHQALASHNL